MSPAAWTFFDASSVSSAAKGFAGTVFDGRYLYLIPYFDPDSHGLVTRYDTHATFLSAEAWTTFDLSVVNEKARGFVSGTFDGRYMYLAPFSNELGYSSTFVRYDTTANFQEGASWSSFDTTTIDPNALGYRGAVFDGRYVYFVPAYNWTFGPHGDIARFDTHGAFGDQTAWTTFDISTFDPAARGFTGGIFDGRYVTFVPSGTSGVVARYDTLATFAARAAWDLLDLTTVSPKAKGFYSGGFDGRYIYLAEYWDGAEPNGLVVRFDARSVPCIPSTYRPGLRAGSASFF